jgi:hypothetical protein
VPPEEDLPAAARRRDGQAREGVNPEAPPCLIAAHH